MIDDGLRDVNQRMAPTYPPVTEIAILRGSKGWIESTAFSKEFGGDSHIVRWEKSQIAVVLEKISVSLIHDDLARRRIRIVGQSVDRPSADKSARIIAEYPRQFLQPLWLWSAIIVGKGQDFSACVLRPKVACRGRTGIPLPQNLDIDAFTILGRSHGNSAAIVDENDLKTVLRIVELTQRSHARLYSFRSVVGRNDNGTVRGRHDRSLS